MVYKLCSRTCISMFGTWAVVAVILCELGNSGLVQSISLDEDISMTYSEGLILDKFKQRMLPRLKEDYMKDDIYLIRWLRARRFNIDEAEKMLLNNLRWRKENRVDYWDKEDWSFFEEEFGYSLETTDNEGRPVATLDSSKWNVRAAVLSGQRDKLIKWMTKMFEDATKKVRELQDEGRNVTRWGMIYNLGYFNLIQGACLQCLPVYASFIHNYENYYPNTVDRITLVNTPGIFEAVLQFVRPLMSPSTRNLLRVYGTNKKQWQEVLLQEIPISKLPKEYGGSGYRDGFD